MDRVPIEIGSFHHVYNRGTDKRIIFNDAEDYRRFILYLNVVNNIDVQSPTIGGILREEIFDPIPTERLVNLIAFCLMPNHFHLLLQERLAGGISKFMQRLSTAYTMYFNENNERSGALFQGRFKSKFIDSELYLLKVIDYIHLNPKELYRSVKLEEALKTYNWSSYHHYCGENKFGYLVQLEGPGEVTKIPSGREYRRWLNSQNNFEDIQHLSIDNDL